MEILQIKDLSFTYPNEENKALDGVDISVKKGEFVLLCGASGCGKTTLLRLLKREIAPFGAKSGEIIYNNTPTEKLDDRESASRIGFVGQNPDDQIVTDKVWHELSFGLENLGVEQSKIRRRVGEMASFFGIHNWYHSNTDELSGGQKQLLNLASVMVMNPEILLLDEPTSQLDPIAASDFIATLGKLNRETGLTIILVEHRLEEVFPIVDKVITMHDGKVLFCDEPRKVCSLLKGNSLESGLPSAVRIYNALDTKGECPLTVREGRDFLEKNYAHKSAKYTEEKALSKGETVIEAKNLWFRYEKNLPDVITDLDISIKKGEILSILGGNGSGKTTTLNLLAGLDKPYKGKIKLFGKNLNSYKSTELYRQIALLPQNPKLVFGKDKVKDDFIGALKTMGIDASRHEDVINKVVSRFGAETLLDKHPYDLSGGEQQKCALCKLLLTEPKILFLDEPTKGFDPQSKQNLIKMLSELKSDGKTVVIVTHDVEFAASVSDRCALFFDGKIISDGTPNSFFSGNAFYTTAASRISRGLFENTVLCEEVVSCCKGESV